MKKGQGLSLNTIIIAAIVLVVLIVLWAIFTGRMGAFTAGVKEQDIKTEEAVQGIKEELGGTELPACPLGNPATERCECGVNTCDVGKVCSGGVCT